MNNHPSDEAILHHIEAADEATAAHLQACDTCRAVSDDFVRIINVLRDSRAWASADEELRTRILTACEQPRALGTTAWAMYLSQHPEDRQSAVAHAIIKDAQHALGRDPARALGLLDLAETVASDVTDADARVVLGDIWKHRSNALRHLGRYQEALEAAQLAESFYDSLPAGTFDVGQALYTRAATLFKMTEYTEAIAVLARAAAILSPYGPTLPLAKTIILAGAIRTEHGDLTGAREHYQHVLPLLARLGDQTEQARVLANLAECELRMGHYDNALTRAEEAIERYRTLGMDAEITRTTWTIGMIHLARGNTDDGIEVLTRAAADFAHRAMHADAGFVMLDVCEARIEHDEWEEAERTARELASLFTRAKVPLASARAIGALREAVLRREATPASVHSVREMLGAADAPGYAAPPESND